MIFLPAKNDTVVVLGGCKVVGTIKRYRSRKGWIASVPGILHPAEHRGECFFKSIGAARAAITERAERA
jgi:hypothetical protein